jgi:hypothetical protein
MPLIKVGQVVAVPLPDEGSQQLLSGAEAVAHQALTGGPKTTGEARARSVSDLKSEGFTDAQLAPPTMGPSPNASVVGVMGAGPSPTAQAPGDEGPSANAQEMQWHGPVKTKTEQKTPGTMQGFWDEFGNKLGEGLAATGKGLSNLGWGVFANTGNRLLPGDSDARADAGFKAIADTYDPAIKYYQENSARNAEQTSEGAKIVAGGIAGLAPLALGPEAYMGQAAMNAGTESVDAGQDLKTTYALVATNLIANAAGMSVPFKSPSVIKRVLANGTFAAGVSAASEWAAQGILRSGGYRDAADKIDPTDPASLITSGLMGGIFGWLAKPKNSKGFIDRGGTLPPELMPPPEGEPGKVGAEPPPPADIGGGIAIDNTGSPVQFTGARPADHPTAEPIADLKAQVADMKDPKTARKAVYLSPENRVALGPDGLADLAQGTQQMRNFDGKGGVLLVDGPEGAKAARALKKSNPDMQAVLGELTGAGGGKTNEATMVVQGKTPEGAVASESLVKPEEVQARAQEMAQEGKTPVVTTMPEALARREAGVASPEAPPAEIGVAPGPSEGAVPVAPEAAEKPKPVTAAPEELQKPAAGPERVIIRTGGGERAAIVQGEAKEGKRPVMLVDHEGEPTGTVVHVPEEAIVRGQTVKEEAPPEAPVKTAPAPEPVRQSPAEPVASAPQAESVRGHEDIREQPASNTENTNNIPVAFQHLDQVRAEFKQSEVPPEGKKRAGSVKDRAGNIAAFARQLMAAAKAAHEGGLADESRVQAAADAARAVARLDLKSEEAMGKGQGIGHSMMDWHAKNMLDAAEGLMNPKHTPSPPELPNKSEKIKARVLKERENRSAATKSETKSNEPKVKVIEDVPDETKPRKVTAGEVVKLKAAGDALVKAEDEPARKVARDRLTKLIQEVQPHLSTDDVETMVAYHEGEARDRARPKTRDEEVDEEFNDQRYDNPMRTAPASAQRLVTPLATRLDQSGFHGMLHDVMDLNTPMSLHRLLDQIIGTAEGHQDSAIIGSIAKAIRNVVPDMAVYSRSRVLDAQAGPTEDLGMHSYFPGDGRQEIQIRAGENSKGIPPYQILLHEAVHGATVRFMRANPNHPFTKEIERLHQIAKEREVYMHLEQGPLEKIYDMYGMENPYEFMSEALTNPSFKKFLMDSENYRQPGEKLRPILHQLADAIRGLFGMKSGRQGQLFDNILDVTGKIMGADKEFNGEAIPLNHPSRTAAALQVIQHAMADKPQRALPHEGELRRTVGDRAADTARDFNRSVRGRVPAAVRRVVLADETHDQILRTNSHWFGSDDHLNPMNQLANTEQQKAVISGKMLGRAGEISRDRSFLGKDEDSRLGALQRDTTIWGIDPTKAPHLQSVSIQAEPKFQARYDDFTARWNKLSPEAQGVYTKERDWNEWATKQMRRAAIDVSLDSYSDRDVTQAQRALLYSARSPGDYESLVGTGKLIDVGDRNKGLIDSLNNTASLHQIDGPYFHLGRHGDLVVQVKPEGDRSFGTKAEAQAFSDKIRALSPKSTAKIEELGGKFNVNYKADYVSMHSNAVEAQEHAEALRRQGFDVGPVTQKVLSENSTPLAGGVQNVVAEATRRLTRNGAGPETDALVAALKKTYTSILASRSAYAASKLARKGSGGVKPEEMGRNFAEHAQSLAWNTSHLSTMFKAGEALGKIRDMAKNPEGGVDQKTVTRRGQVMDELNKRLTQDISQYGQPKSALNSAMAKLGFMNFLASPSHAGIWMTQNFTTAMPVAGARWGYGKTFSSFGHAMRVVSGPAFHQAFMEHLYGLPGTDAHFNGNRIEEAVLRAVQKDPRLAKWAKGENSHLAQLMDRGLLQSSFYAELGNMAQGKGLFGNVGTRAFDYARLLPHMADVFNRISTGLAGLELTGGDLSKALDFVKETHMDYGQGNKSRVFKMVGRNFNSITMFRTYTQGMAHLLYSNIKNMVYAETKSRAEAAKTVAGMVLGTSIFAGVIKGAVLEPVRLAVYAYNKLFNDPDNYFDLDTSIRHFVSDLVGPAAVQAITGGLPRLLGFDLSSRMGLSDLFLHDPPDLLGSTKDKLMAFAGTMLGPMPQMVADQYTSARDAFERGDMLGGFMHMVPIKAMHDVQKAWQLYSSGRQSTLGAQLTPPSAGAAVWQALGLKPSGVANVQEREGTVRGYKAWEDQRKFELISQYMTSPEGQKGSIMDRIQHFNTLNPGHKISYSDFRRAQVGVKGQEAVATGQPTRDPRANELVNY